MSLRENNRLAELVQSEIRAMTLACTQAQGINLAQGVCDTGVPKPVVQGAKQAMEMGFNTYTRFDGLAELRQALAQRMKTFNHMTVNPETEMTVSAGASGAFHCVCMALLYPGDEVIMFEPYYGYHLSAVLAVEAVPRIVSLQRPDWFFFVDEGFGERHHRADESHCRQHSRQSVRQSLFNSRVRGNCRSGTSA